MLEQAVAPPRALRDSSRQQGPSEALSVPQALSEATLQESNLRLSPALLVWAVLAEKAATAGPVAPVEQVEQVEKAGQAGQVGQAEPAEPVVQAAQVASAPREAEGPRWLGLVRWTPASVPETGVWIDRLGPERRWDGARIFPRLAEKASWSSSTSLAEEVVTGACKPIQYSGHRGPADLGSGSAGGTSLLRVVEAVGSVSGGFGHGGTCPYRRANVTFVWL